MQEGDGSYTTATPWTYFVQAGSDGPIKIGSTKNLAVRLRSLATMSPVPLTLLGIVPANVEETCHVRFGAFRLHGEWFAPAPELIAFITKNAVTRAMRSPDTPNG